jgi:hypothetical protein
LRTLVNHFSEGIDVSEEGIGRKAGGTGISRREFARKAALASALASVVPASALADQAVHAKGVAGLAGTDSKSPIQAAGSKLSPEGQAEVEARVHAILGQYGSRFSEEQKADIRRLCDLVQPPLDRLRAYALENGDNPALYLKPLVEREKNPLENTRVGKTPSGGKP